MRNLLRTLGLLALGASGIAASSAHAEQPCTEHHFVATQFSGTDVTVNQNRYVLHFCSAHADPQDMATALRDVGKMTADIMTLLGSVIIAAERPIADYEQARITRNPLPQPAWDVSRE